LDIPRYRTLKTLKIETLLDPAKLNIDRTFRPTEQDFKDHWTLMSLEQRKIVATAVRSATIGDIADALVRTTRFIAAKIRDDAEIGYGIVVARLCSMTTDASKALYLETLEANAATRELAFDELNRVIKTDKDHLQELASKLVVTGDGKRELLKELIAYGMQTKKVEDEVIDQETGLVRTKAVYSLADPRMAFNSIQELNRMDHEYGADDKATSSVEGQADRIRRLQQQMQTVANKEAAVAGGIAKRVEMRELRRIDGDGDDGG
jgi:uncharacterized coiled-coil protein SlyX